MRMPKPLASVNRELEESLRRPTQGNKRFCFGAENCRVQGDVGRGDNSELEKPEEGALGRFYLLVLRRRTLARQRFRPELSYSVLSSWNVCVGKETVAMKYVQGSICGV